MANENGLDEAYFAEMTGLTPDLPDTSDNGGENGQQPPANEQAATGSEQVVDKAAPNNQQQPTQQPQPKDGQQPQQVAQAPAEGLRQHPSGKFVDGKGNITEADGSVVATQGYGRRQYEENVRLRTRVEQSDQRAAALHQEVQSRQFLNDIPRQYQLSNEQVAEGLDFARRIKQGDLLGVAKDLVAKAAAGGVNISEIVGTTVGDSVDMRAIRAMMDERLGPITRAEAQTVEQDQARERATTAYNEFISINEYADVQGEIIAAYAKNNGVPLQKAYNDVRNFAATNQLDFSLPLGPQIEERRAQAAVPVEQQQQQQQPANNTQLRPMPNGVSTHSSAVTPQTPVYADPDDDWGSIIRRAQSADRPN
jgi:hypothetical protein